MKSVKAHSHRSFKSQMWEVVPLPYTAIYLPYLKPSHSCRNPEYLIDTISHTEEGPAKAKTSTGNKHLKTLIN